MQRSLSLFVALVSLTLVAGVTPGCQSRTTVASIPSIRDLTGQVGSLTYDDAIRGYGIPASSATLGDGSVIAEWEAGARQGPSFTLGLGSASGPVGVGTGATVGGEVKRIFRQLTFGPQGRLESVRDFVR